MAHSHVDLSNRHKLQEGALPMQPVRNCDYSTARSSATTLDEVRRFGPPAYRPAYVDAARRFGMRPRLGAFGSAHAQGRIRATLNRAGVIVVAVPAVKAPDSV